MRVRISGWATTAMSPEATEVARRLRLVVIGDSPRGPWLVRRDGAEYRGGNVDALVLKAAKELTND